MACTYSTGKFNEPGLRGKLIDAETKLPIQGAVIYGYYATAEGSIAGGETIKEILRVFEVESNAEGIFEIPPWRSENWLTRGEPRQRFPAIGIYKDGYKVDTQMLRSIEQWVPHSEVLDQKKVVNNIVDRTGAPARLFPARTETERYNAIRNSSDAYAEIGPCGWEQHVKLLTAQHVAWKSWIRRNIPVEHIDGQGYGKGNYFHPNPHIRTYSTRSRVDKLRENFETKKSDWKCANPSTVFKS